MFFYENIFSKRLKTINDEKTKEMIENHIKKVYKKWIIEDVYIMLISFGLAFISTQLFFFTNSIISKVSNVFNIILALWIFTRNAKSFIKDIDKLADIEISDDCIL